MQAGGSTPFILDTTNPAAGWTAATRSMFDNPATGDVNPVRENADSVILPTGEILIEGGFKVGSSDATGVTSPELFDPTTSARQVLPHSPVVRGYHSTALLMPNGAVWVAGSNFNANPGLSNRELRIEIFEPWYFCGRRPTITDAPPRSRHGDEVQILTPDAVTVTRVVLVRAGTVTHNFNPDQRHVTLEFRRGEADSIIATVPNDPNLAIVGYHLLFVIDGTGRPSTGRFLQITPRTGGWSPGLQDEWWERCWRTIAALVRTICAGSPAIWPRRRHPRCDGRSPPNRTAAAIRAGTSTVPPRRTTTTPTTTTIQTTTMTTARTTTRGQAADTTIDIGTTAPRGDAGCGRSPSTPPLAGVGDQDPRCAPAPTRSAVRSHTAGLT